MIPVFDGQDYMLRVSSQEIVGLPSASLSANLVDLSNNDLGKRVILEFGENSGPDGIEFKYLPEDYEDFESIEEVNVKVNQRALDHVKQTGFFGTRYNGSDKVEIFRVPDRMR